MKLWFLPAVAAALVLGAGRPVDARETPSASDKMKALRKEVDDALAAYLEAAKAYKEGDPEEKIDALWKAFMAKTDANGPKVLELVRQDPKSAVAFEALEWIVFEPRNPYQPYGRQAIELLRDHHTTNPKIARLCGALGYWWSWEHEPTMAFLRAAAEKNPDRTARGHAVNALARLTRSKARALEYRKNADAKRVSQEAEELFETVVEKYADCPNLRERPRSGGVRVKGTLGDEAQVELFEIRHLAVGKTAPEIAGEDLDGQKFKLSDYRGKVVVLDFWGHW